jgi:7-keto-8-aminopelargonate synthetase-like enzyme
MVRGRSLDDYVTRRLRIAGGSLARPEAMQESIAAAKTVWLQPIDVIGPEYRTAVGGFVSFATYDYLGLGEVSRIRQAAARAALELGVGAGASRLVGGSRSVHDQLERDLADFLGVEDCISLVSGYLTNASLIGHLLTKSDLVFVDDLSHNSVVAGAEISRATIIRFAHNDLDHLEALLEARRGEGRRALIVVEGLYSMDGDIPDLPRLIALRDRYDGWLLVDEAHSIGVLGATGRGLCEHYGVDPGAIDFIVGTLSKTFCASGGFIASRTRVVDWLRFTLPGFVFSVGASPVIATAALEALSVLKEEPWRVRSVQDNAAFFLAAAQVRGLDVGTAIGAPVIAVQFSSYEVCMTVAKELLAAGYYAPPIPQIAVPRNRPRIRFFVSALHQRSDIEAALDIVAAFQGHAEGQAPEPDFALQA